MDTVERAVDGPTIEVHRAAFGKELGDLLLQVVFHSELASERGDFDLDEVASMATTEGLMPVLRLAQAARSGR